MVAVVEVVERDVPLLSEWIATLDGYVNAQIRPEVTGYLVRRVSGGRPGSEGAGAWCAHLQYVQHFATGEISSQLTDSKTSRFNGLWKDRKLP
jgi:hypothetical protein